MELIEQRAAIKFCVKLSHNASQTLEMLKTAYGDACLSRTSVFEWHKRFREGRTSLQDDPREGRPSNAKSPDNIEAVRVLLQKSRRLTCRGIAETLGLSKTVVHEILTGPLNKRKVCSRFVPHSLRDEEKERRMLCSREIIDMADCDSDFLNSIVAGDESWCYEYDPSTKRQTCEWISPGEARGTKVRASKSKVKTMLIAFFDARGIIHHEFVPPNTTVNKKFYKGVMTRLLARMRRVRKDLYDSGDWFLLHDNAPAHTAIMVQQYLAKRKVVCLDHPPYSPDLAPPDYFLFPKLKMPMKGHHYSSIEAIQEEVTRVLRSIPEEDFSRAFQRLYERSQTCIALNGDYIEV